MIQGHNPAVRVQQKRGGNGGIQQGLGGVLALACLLLGAFALCDVAGDTAEPHRFSARVAQDPGAAIEQAADAVAAGGINCTLWVSTDPTTDCSVGFNDYGMSELAVTTAGDWSKMNSEQSFMNVSTGGGSIYISIACLDYSGTQDFILSVDDVYVGINMVPVELHSFTIE